MRSFFRPGDHFTMSRAGSRVSVSACASPSHPSKANTPANRRCARREMRASFRPGTTPAKNHARSASIASRPSPLCGYHPDVAHDRDSFLRSGVDTVYATHLPSLDTCGSVMRCRLIMSSKAMGRLTRFLRGKKQRASQQHRNRKTSIEYLKLSSPPSPCNTAHCHARCGIRDSVTFWRPNQQSRSVGFIRNNKTYFVALMLRFPLLQSFAG